MQWRFAESVGLRRPKELTCFSRMGHGREGRQGAVAAYDAVRQTSPENVEYLALPSRETV